MSTPAKKSNSESTHVENVQSPAKSLRSLLRIFRGPEPDELTAPSNAESSDQVEDTIVIPDLPAVSVDMLHERLGFDQRISYPQASRVKPLIQWQMEEDDAPIFRYLYRNAAPRRHLEFGTWQGTGAVYCLQESSATVWSINLLEGEPKPNGEWAYGELVDDRAVATSWVETQASPEAEKSWYRTDAYGFIGRFIHQANLGHRVCQIFCDSRKWDASNYPAGFFDTVLIDGGHQEDVVVSDTHKALGLLRPGGLILWHDFCPHVEVYEASPTVRGVAHALSAMEGWLQEECSDLFWVDPSWIVIGVKS